MQSADKREREKRIVTEMIGIYCKGNHKRATGLCAQCRELNEYAMQRSDKCPFMDTKTFCSNCTVHCYREDMRQEIRAVMRYAGPRMILHHPIMAIRHVLENRGEKKRLEKTGNKG